MALLMRGGAYEKFDPAKLRPREWAVVLSGDPQAKYGRAAYLCFGSGDVRMMATYEDAKDIILNATEQIREEFSQMFEEILSQMQEVKSEVERYRDVIITNVADAERFSEKAAENAQEAKSQADLSRSYAVGTENTIRDGDATDNAKSYSEKAKASADESKENLEKVEQAGDEAVKRINDALNIVEPRFYVDLSTGDLLYRGFMVEFLVVDGDLMWRLMG